MFFIYLLMTLLIVGIVFSALMPEHARFWLKKLGLWERVQAVDGEVMQRWMRGLGQLMMLIAVVLAGSVIMDQRSSAWLVPAGQAAFFGVILWFFGKHSKREE